jgi:predicted component of type VI protein secretion system
MAYLQFKDEARSIGPGVLTIGSGSEAGWRVIGHDLLPVHAVVSLERGYATVTPGRAGAPLTVRGEAVTEGSARLDYNDTMLLGAAEFRFVQLPMRGAEDDVFLNEARVRRSFRLGEHAMIGRDGGCGVRLTEPEVSRIHAEVERRGTSHWIRPSGQALTLVNGSVLREPRMLVEGDEISIGRSVLRFSRRGIGQRVDAEGDHPVQTTASTPTTYAGVYAARDREGARARRRTMLIMIAVVVMIALVMLLVG